MTLSKKKIFLFAALAVIAVGAIIGYGFYKKIMAPNVPRDPVTSILLIPRGSTVESVIDSMQKNNQLLREDHFRWAADKMGYDETTLRPGRYTIKPGSSNRVILTLLRGGQQTPLNVTIQNVRTLEQMVGRVANKLEFDSTELLTYIDAKLDSLSGTTPPTRLTRFLPNTYEFYWTVSPEDFVERMLKEYDRFWTEEKLAQAQAIGLTPEEVYTLASIIEKETNHNAEKSRMAGVYLNRIEQGIPLQADPTIVFALNDFDIRRVLYGHLQVDSPYNTYKNLGLPPGPIFMPGVNTINAVLNKETHDYLYFCARPTDEGPGHAFASSLPAHNENARRYQRWLDSRGIQ